MTDSATCAPFIQIDMTQIHICCMHKFPQELQVYRSKQKPALSPTVRGEGATEKEKGAKRPFTNTVPGKSCGVPCMMKRPGLADIQGTQHSEERTGWSKGLLPSSHPPHPSKDVFVPADSGLAL
jgi:hypothetical protein